jgi:hypothetical protein
VINNVITPERANELMKYYTERGVNMRDKRMALPKSDQQRIDSAFGLKGSPSTGAVQPSAGGTKKATSPLAQAAQALAMLNMIMNSGKNPRREAPGATYGGQGLNQRSLNAASTKFRYADGGGVTVAELLRRLAPMKDAGEKSQPYQRPSGGTRAAEGGYFKGGTPGQSDKIPAMLSDGEFVIDADTVAALGDGNNAAGASALEQMRRNIRKHKRSAPASKIPPKAKKPEQYLKGKK